MQTTIGTSVGGPGPFYHRRNRKSERIQCEQKETDTGAQRVGNGFLTAGIKPTSLNYITRDYCASGENLIMRENYEYLLASAMNYTRLIGRKLTHNPGRTYGEGISNLYDEFNEILGDIRLNIETDNDRLEFWVYDYHDWPDYMFFWLPVKFIERTHGKLRRLAISFVNRFSENNGLLSICKSDEVDMISEHMYECLTDDNGWDEDDLKHTRELYNSYTGGSIRRLLERIDTKCYYKKLPQAIKRYQPQDEWEEELIKHLVAGLDFISPDTPSIMHYAYDPQFDEDADWRPVDLDRIIRVVYDINDWFSDYLEEWLNSELRESYDIRPVTVMKLSPDSREQFSKDDYPERFAKWFNEFIYFLRHQ